MAHNAASASIIAKVPSQFHNALKSGDLLFFPSTIVKHVDSGVEYEIRLCPALQQKPALPVPHFDKVIDNEKALNGNGGKKFDPFCPPYNENLHVGELKDEDSGEEFVVLLNKFSVVPQHFLLVTKEFKSQASPLMPPELVQTYLLLSAARRSGRNLFAFYNCGNNSGASQPHKHIQFIPLDDDIGPPIEVLARSKQLEFPDRPFSLTNLSYASHTYRLPSNASSASPEKLEEILSSVFLQLLDLSIATIRHDPTYPAGTPSYNVIITLEHIHIIPRRLENHKLTETGDAISVNAVGFAGMLLVKSDEELEAIKREGISKILRGVGVESVHDTLVEGTSAEAQLAGL